MQYCEWEGGFLVSFLLASLTPLTYITSLTTCSPFRRGAHKLSIYPTNAGMCLHFYDPAKWRVFICATSPQMPIPRLSCLSCSRLFPKAWTGSLGPLSTCSLSSKRKLLSYIFVITSNVSNYSHFYGLQWSLCLTSNVRVAGNDGLVS